MGYETRFSLTVKLRGQNENSSEALVIIGRLRQSNGYAQYALRLGFLEKRMK